MAVRHINWPALNAYFEYKYSSSSNAKIYSVYEQQSLSQILSSIHTKMIGDSGFFRYNLAFLKF
ncbi:hypothetical protein KAM398_02550 [Acinetobacter sp. KAM398]|uniref:hypothetical protein n=1 Tax=unclassified Acinetobacter TaxID=196816 RepID=UPI001F480055|nr:MULTISPECIES: hypothetical protein [unclassified Acinetobacter]GJC33086.1 hypothetical protein KAM393_02550 [Acinetobacter sp. KAM393]GJC35915.1 hypothetical protein KAM394_02550 [Acinetobacter sp. KAM394]GJC38510.1 hypothetical protein KAM395_00310 [Acinetobacter sp. KAM395]GJC41335.1 hypothetical protein KAM396_00320 [Acinetobacter sp. KAM396]GJC44375.1 hypothetical protein KAM397_02550 [Acinetobacter sp. KAM397]GJC47203.1 hypothetical protein KAM398_02550 [Acinetobacter sp. KAM398]GJC5